MPQAHPSVEFRRTTLENKLCVRVGSSVDLSPPERLATPAINGLERFKKCTIACFLCHSS